MYSYDGLRAIELEISTYCNAACPQCPRNIYGGETLPNLPLINWSLDQLRQVLQPNFIQQLEFVYFCGTYGDPLMNSELVAMCEYIKSNNINCKIGIHTNGGVGRTETYSQLAKLCDFIAFGIDGLEDTNHLYRRNTDFNTIIHNAKTFIDAGGNANWDFIVFRHNQHQVESARQLSQQLGFKEFSVKRTHRFFNKKHELVDEVRVYGRKGNYEYTLAIPDKQYENMAYDVIRQTNLSEYIRTTKITCFWRSKNKVFVSADGDVFPCGFLHDRMYGLEAEQSYDHHRMKKVMYEVGGAAVTNVFVSPLKSIVEGEWFKWIQNSWGVNHFDRCAIYCGEKINMAGVQNLEINYLND